MKEAFARGASGVQIGTRFALSEECSAARVWKEILLNAKPEDIVLVHSPVGLPFRAVKTAFVKRQVEKGEDDIDEICRGCLRDCDRWYCIIRALEQAQQGDVENGLFTTGERVVEIDKILPVQDIVDELVREYEDSFADDAEVERV